MRDVELSFQNNNPQGIIAYSVEVINQRSKQSYLIANFPFEGGRAIPTGQVFTEKYSIRDAYDLIKLAAVVFEDGTIEGDSSRANYVKGHCVGTREQYRLALDVFHRVESNNAADDLQLNEGLKKGFAQLPEQPDEVPGKKSSRESQQYFMGRSMGMTQAKNNLLAEVEGATEKLTVERVDKGVGDPGARIKKLKTEKSRMEAVVRMNAPTEKPSHSQ
jgi:hypothetical protein